MDKRFKQVVSSFRKHFGREEQVVRSPGRVNLIGEHTDYNGGFVLPAALDKAIILVLAPSPDKRVHLYSVDLAQKFDCDIKTLQKSQLGWPNYLLGVVDQFQQLGISLAGFSCAFGGDIPIGAGMSSSAAIEGGLAFALNEIFSLGLDKLELVKLAQRAENQFVGVQCGIMDQFINIFGRERMVLKIDCRSLDYQYYPFSSFDYHIVLCDTRVRRQLATSEYNVRRCQCEEGVALLSRYETNISSLRDVSLKVLEKHKERFDPLIYRRCLYVVKENMRVEEACACLEKNDFKAFGQLMNLSHAGLRDDYQVSCQELDSLADIALDLPGVLGARMMGAGFGGCTIQLVEKDRTSHFCQEIKKKYNSAFGTPMAVYVAELSGATDLAAMSKN